jgi:hypothetical protein
MNAWPIFNGNIHFYDPKLPSSKNNDVATFAIYKAIASRSSCLCEFVLSELLFFVLFYSASLVHADVGFRTQIVIFLNCSDSEIFWNCSDSKIFWNCSDSEIFVVFHFIVGTF